MEKSDGWALVAMGGLLAVGMSAAAFILAGQFRTVGDNRQSIVVKGLAEKPVRADRVEWTLGVQVEGNEFADTLQKLRVARPVVDEFLAAQGLRDAPRDEGSEEVEPRMVSEYQPQGGTRYVQRGYEGKQKVLVRTQDLATVTKAYKAIIQLKADGKPVVYGNPNYLISDLETIKMSLIGAATRNARQRAQEFAQVGDVEVGSMRSASQGAFYILPANSEADASDYGGVYDKSTIDKKARVVVTIDYSIR